MTRKFQRCREDFSCEHCGASVIGNGYTNHCPRCLWCKHVDVQPGDRAALCGGMLRPIGWTLERQVYIVTHRCEVCGFERRNKLSTEDDMTTLAKLPQKEG